jgi:Alkylmercury lyase
MCAVDALGIPLLLRRSALITSADALMGEPIRVVMRPPADPRSLPLAIPFADWRVSWDPDSIAVYARSEEHLTEHDAGTCVAAGTCCPITNFFRSAEDAGEWTTRQGAAAPADGLVLTQAEALAYAHKVFAGVLDRLAL